MGAKSAQTQILEAGETAVYWKVRSILGLVLALSLGHAATATACSQRMGPFGSIYAAENAAQLARAAGYETSGIWGQGGIVSDWSNRRYFFNVFYQC